MDQRSDSELNGVMSSKKQQRGGESCQNGVESSFMAECRCVQIEINGDCKCYKQNL
jgi:hypothetical protein